LPPALPARDNRPAIARENCRRPKSSPTISPAHRLVARFSETFAFELPGQDTRRETAMDEYLNFRRLITPSLVQIVFWLGLVFILIIGLGTMFSWSFWQGLGILVLGPLVLRIYCEIVIVLFRINNTLTDMLDLQRETGVRPVTAPPIV
jgi:Domain of unknown function (DUF4282)